MDKNYFNEGDQERIAVDAKERSSSKRSGLGYQQQQQQQQQQQDPSDDKITAVNSTTISALIKNKIKEQLNNAASNSSNSSNDNTLTFHNHSKSVNEWIRADMIGQGDSLIEEEYNVTGRSSSTNINDINKRRMIINAVNTNTETIAESIIDTFDMMTDSERHHHDAIYNATSTIDNINTNTNTVIEKPIYKILKKGDSIMAMYNDGKYYKATIKSIMHAGYSSAKYDITFDGYSNTETISWTDIMLCNNDNDNSNSNTSVTIDNSNDNSVPIYDAFGRDISLRASSTSTSTTRKPAVIEETIKAAINNSINRLSESYHKKRVYDNINDNNNVDVNLKSWKCIGKEGDDNETAALRWINPTVFYK